MFTLPKQDAYRVYIIYSALWSLSLTLAFTVNMVYLVLVIGLDPLQLVLVGTALELSAFLTEVPTGVVADMYSRRLSVIIGTITMGLSFFIFIVPSFPVILLSQVVLGVGWTFISGAESAWITDEIGESAAGRAFLRRSQINMGVTIFGIIVSVALAMIDLRISIVACGLLLLVTGLYVLVFMPETGFSPAPREEQATFRSMLSTAREGVHTIRGRPVLITLIIVIAVWGAFTEGFDRLWVLHILENFDLPQVGEFDMIIWFGVIGIVSSIIGMVVTEYVRRKVNTDDQIAIARSLIRINTGLIVALVVFALAGQFVIAMIAFWIAGALRGINYPLREAWINKGLNPRVRATVISMTSQADAIGQIAGGPGIGLIGRQLGVRVALALGGVILMPVLGLYARTIQQNGRLAEPVLEAEAPPLSH